MEGRDPLSKTPHAVSARLLTEAIARRGRARFVGAALFLVASCLAADEAIVTHNVNLREGPAVTEHLIRLLKPPDHLTLLDTQATNSYLHVRTDADEEG
jgi:hypothetical protein